MLSLLILPCLSDTALRLGTHLPKIREHLLYDETRLRLGDEVRVIAECVAAVLGRGEADHDHFVELPSEEDHSHRGVGPDNADAVPTERHK